MYAAQNLDDATMGHITTMDHVKTSKKAEWISVIPDKIPEDITAEDAALFEAITLTDLTKRQAKQIYRPARIFTQQDNILAIHWHPEFIPMALIAKRLEAMYPNQRDSLIIPTQHNMITTYGNYAGVEIDCYSQGFNQKVQLLLHFKKAKIKKADTLKAILKHTFKYRSSQLYDFIDTIAEPHTARINLAARETGANEALIRFTQIYVKKIRRLIEAKRDSISAQMIKNKILRNFFDGLRPKYGDALIDRTQTYLKAVKILVKADFPLQYFYRTAEVIEEARALGAGIVIPHPEQFWPILLADYDVDGIEVWNPQSRKYTEFLISVINKKNRNSGALNRNLLIFMGDDTHMSEKVRDPEVQNPEKASREVGYQPAWDDFSIRKALIRSDTSRSQSIQAYKQRLG
jgi:hypothetical protein